MVPLMSLWLPIVASAVLVFIASWIMHAMLTYHRADIRGVPAEDDVLAAFRRFGLPPGDYAVPHAGSMERMKDPAFVEKMKQGPIVFMTVVPGQVPAMGSNLVQWFVYLLVVSLFAAYVAGRALGPGAAYLEAFRFSGTVAFAGYALALWQNSIWWRRSWGTTIRSTIDGLVYALLTGGVFGWLWPR